MLWPDSQLLTGFKAGRLDKSWLTIFEAGQTNQLAELEDYMN